MSIANIQHPNGIAIWSEDEVAVLKELVAKGATDSELVLFAKVCERLQLDPFTKQIYLIKRDGKPTIQTGIDGFRAIADRTGSYAGNDEYRFDEGLTEYEHITSKRGQPVTATATVYKIVQGIRAAFSATVHWKEYYPGDKQGFMWREKPYTMLGKTAESQALRRAFPTQLSGVYTDVEMAQADRPQRNDESQDERAQESSQEPKNTPPRQITSGRRTLTLDEAKRLKYTALQNGYTPTDINDWLKHHQFTGLGQLTEPDADLLRRHSINGVRPWIPQPAPETVDPELVDVPDLDGDWDAELNSIPNLDDTPAQYEGPVAATPRQIKFLYALARENGMTDEALAEDVIGLYDSAVDELSRHDASDYIERLQQRRDALVNA